jgi:dehydrodolichyl diphosphate syntase complex subunit NUS1
MTLTFLRSLLFIRRPQQRAVQLTLDMGLLAALTLRVLHFLYALISLIYSFWRRQTRPSPQPLQSSRQRLPKNLALVFVGDANIPQDVVNQTILLSCMNAVEWCRVVGIPKLTIYEEHGTKT